MAGTERRIGGAKPTRPLLAGGNGFLRSKRRVGTETGELVLCANVCFYEKSKRKSRRNFK
jgi:hypothetical protein